jgi:exosortase
LTLRTPLELLAGSRRRAGFVFLLIMSCCVWWIPILRTVDLALTDDAYTHILLILPLAISLLWLERNMALQPRSSRNGSGIACLVIAAVLAGVGKWRPTGIPEDWGLFLSMFGLVTWWIGSVIVCFGRQTFTKLVFALCFLFWIVPLPSAAVDQVVYFLQNESAFAARLMFQLVGVPVTQDGVMLSIPNLDIEVARECSSIRSSMLLVVTTMILAHLFLRSSWRKAVLIACAIPLAAIKNGIRIFVITELATRVDPGFFDGNLHRRGGILFLALAMAMVGALLWGLRRNERIASFEPTVSSAS